ncbi:MAG: hypothetical protein ACXAEU_03955 [Candidatus Hodarchaeales archaeon]|jgi:hypothetical protein
MNKNLETFVVLATKYLTSRDLNFEIVLFGSKVGDSKFIDSYLAVSDTDLLVIIDTKGVQNDEWLKITLFFEKLDEYSFQKESKSPLFLRTLNRLTGMFRNVFVAKLDALEKKDFTSMFSVSKAASFLIPSEKVFENILNKHLHLAGQNYINTLRYPIQRVCSKVELLKSLFLNLFLSMGSLTILLVFQEATLYSMEAVKWSVLNTSSNINKMGNKSTNELLRLKILEESRLKRRLFHKLLLLRQKYKRDPTFTLFSPFLVLVLHLVISRSPRETDE